MSQMNTSSSNNSKGWRQELTGGLILFITVLLSGCSSTQHARLVTTGPPLLEPIVPAGYKKIAPTEIDSSEQMLAQTATIFRGVLKDVRFTYDQCAGPRTEYTFAEAVTLAGTRVESQLTLKVLGGPTPRGTWLRVSTVPQLALDCEYVAFLRNTDWTLSPIVGSLVFRRETIAGREVLIDPTGHAVIAWGRQGPVLSAKPVSEAVGRQIRGYRGMDAVAPDPHKASAWTDPRPEVTPATGNVTAPAVARPEASTFNLAPSIDDIRKSGLFAKPTLTDTALGNQTVVSVGSLIEAVRMSAERAHIDITGRLTLEPYWRCWSSTPTVKTAR